MVISGTLPPSAGQHCTGSSTMAPCAAPSVDEEANSGTEPPPSSSGQHTRTKRTESLTMDEDVRVDGANSGTEPPPLSPPLSMSGQQARTITLIALPSPDVEDDLANSG